SLSIPADVFFAHDVLHAGDVGYGALATVWGAGMVAGAVGLAHRVRREWMVTGALVAIFVQGLGKPIGAIAATLGVALLGYAIGGVGHGMRNAPTPNHRPEPTPHPP